MIPIRSKSPPSTSQQAVLTAPQSRIVPKPTPQQQIQDARGYQLNQLRRRFSPEEKELGDGGETSLLFKLHPSDPDFPFDLDYLDCDLRIPKGYPDQNEMPRLLVKNKNIPRGFAINIEQGWDKLVEERDKQKLNLLGLVNSLDRRLEGLLMEEKKETVKVVIFKDKRHEEEKGKGVDQEKKEKPMQQQQQQQRRPYIPEESFTKEEIAEAKARRAQEVRQLEARMGRLQNYQKSSDGVVYTVPLEPKRKGMLPRGLQQVKSVQLIVPLLYPLQPLRVLLNDVESSEEDAEGLEELFTKKAMTEQKQMSLMSHLNYLAQNMHLLVKQVQKNAVSAAAKTPAVEVVSEKTDVEAKEAEHSSTLETGRGGHVHVIPRPPEWGQMDGSDSSGSSDYDDEDEEEGGAVLGTEPAEETPLPTQTVEKGTAMSFPSFELHGIELLQVSILALSVKCERCKTLNDITGLKNNLEKSSSCKKCATAFTVRFRQELVHMNSTRAGFIDVSGCTVADMLPSTFVPTCDKCSHPAIGIISVRGETITNVCRECHARFTFKIPEVKFLDYAPNDHHSRLPPTTATRKKTEKLGLHAGDPLPERGACQHYKKSFRWFRFSCCAKVYPCDKCHDSAEEHVNEWANRMVCGWCSREQNYSVESCGFCGRSVIGRRGKGYWEGGKGTRDRRLMRRGDKRKFRRVGGSEGQGKKE